MSVSVTWLWVWLALCVASEEPEVLYRRRGQEVQMDCGDVDQNQEFEWKVNSVFVIGTSRSGVLRKGKAKITPKAKLHGTRLSVPSLELSDSGLYSCAGKQSGKTRKHTLRVVSVSVSPAETVLVSTDVTLRCEVGGDSAAQVQWVKPPRLEPYTSSSNTVTLKSVTSADGGQWSCVVRDSEFKEVERMEVNICVVGPLKSPEEVVAPPGGTAELPCYLPSPSSLRIDGGGWVRDTPSDLQFPTLTRDGSADLRWTGVTPRVSFREEHLSTNFTVTVKNVRASDAGVYVCSLTFQDGTSLKTQLRLKVGGGTVTATPGPRGITAPLGGTVELPCTHSSSSSVRIVGGGWARVPPTGVRFPVLVSSGVKGLRWNGSDVLESKVTFSDGELSTDFNISLKHVEPSDAGTYTCTLMLEDGQTRNTTLALTVGEERIVVASGVQLSPVDLEFWKRPVLLDLALWIWVAVAAGSLLLIVLVVVITSVHCRSKRRKRTAEKSKIRTGNIPAEETVPMKDEFPQKRPRPGMKERPLPAVPRHQYKSVNR